MNTERNDTSRMMMHEHRGVTYFLDEDGETFYDADGIVMGYICSRGPMYVCALTDDDGNVVSQVSGNAYIDLDTDDDEPLDLLAAMHLRQQSLV